MYDYMPYIVSVICSLIAGLASYGATRKKAQNDLQMIVKQHEVDIEALKMKHNMEIEKINLEHSHQLELKNKELESQFSSSLLSEALKMPEIRQEISKGMRNNSKRNK